MITRATFATVFMTVGLLSSAVTTSLSQAGQHDDIIALLGSNQAELMKVAAWPADTAAVIGFKFVQGDYAELSEYTMESDTTSILLRGKRSGIWPGMGLVPYWPDGSTIFKGTVCRSIVLKHNDNESHKAYIDIFVTPANFNAKRIMAMQVRSRQRLSALNSPASAWGPDHAMEAGQMLILHDEMWDEGSWSGLDLSCIQDNVLIDLRKERGCDVPLPALAGAMVNKMLEQEATRVASSSPLKPVVTLDLSENTIDFPAMDAADNYLASKTINVTVATSGWTGGLTEYGFYAAKGHPESGVTSEGKITYDETKIIYRAGNDPKMFNEVGNPTTATVWRHWPTNDYHIAVAVWGDNLVPTFAHDTVSVVRGK